MEIVDFTEIKTKEEEEEKELAIFLIKANLMEPPSFHLNNLHNNKINWNKKKKKICFINFGKKKTKIIIYL